MATKVKVNVFIDMKEALRDAAAYERGEAVGLRITSISSRLKRLPRARPRESGPKRDAPPD